MRELKRSIAKANMRKAGYTQIFKKRRTVKNNKPVVVSKFSENWRKWVIPGGKNARLLERASRNEIKRKSRKAAV